MSLREHPAALFAAGQAAAARGDLDAAHDAYKKSLLLLPEDASAARADVYIALGALKARRGLPLEAERCYEKALAYEPTSRGALDELFQSAITRRDWRAAAARGLALARLCRDPSLRVRELLALADAVDAEGGAHAEARTILEAARAAAPRSDVVLARLRCAYERAGQWAAALDVMDTQCTVVTDARARAALRFQQADMAQRHLRDEARARRYLEATLDEDPAHEGALRAYERTLEARGELGAWADVLARALLHARAAGDRPRAAAFARELGALRRDRGYDLPGALAAYDEALDLEPSDVTTRALRADLLYATGDEAAALAELEAIAAAAPERAATYRCMYTIHRRAGRVDGQWLTATVLVELGAADDEQRHAAAALRPAGPLHPGALVDDDVWDPHLRAPGFDPLVAEIVRVVGPKAIALRLAELRSEGRRLTFDPLRKLPRQTTASIARAFEWASRVLDLPAPSLYLLETVPGDLAMAQAEEPTVVVAPALLHGVPIAEHAFLAARHMAYLRPEHYPLVFFPTQSDVTSLFIAVLGLAQDDPPPPGERARRLRKTLEERLDDDERRALRELSVRLAARGGTVDLAAHLRSVELSAGRLGLVLGADLAVALRHVMAEERLVGGLTARERRADLLAFAPSRTHLRVRELLHADARDSLLAPPRSSLPPPASSAPPSSGPGAASSSPRLSVPPLPPVGILAPSPLPGEVSSLKGR